jgi:putative ABC transport system permease protein
VIAYDVSRRVREVGIRMSLGAQRSQVLRLIIGDGLKLVLVGSAIGLGLAWLTSRSLASMLIGVRPGDPVTYGLVAVLFLLVALIATWRPAYTAATINPVEALHRE